MQLVCFEREKAKVTSIETGQQLGYDGRPPRQLGNAPVRERFGEKVEINKEKGQRRRDEVKVGEIS